MRNDTSDTWNPFGAATWIAWLGATIVAAMTMVAYAYSTFETKENSRDREISLVQRLDRIENKVDRVMEQTRH